MANNLTEAKRYRHIKRGTTYTIIGTGHLQHPLHELDLMPITIYRSDNDGTLWARYTKEFHDGRFEELPS